MSKGLKKVAVIGHFGFGQNLLNGQTIKTKIITNELEKKYGENQILKIDTHGGWKAYLKLPFQLLKAERNCKNIIIFPAHNGLKVITPFLSFYNLFFHRSLHYCVIGGWLSKFLESKKTLTKQLKKFKGIYVETNTMKKSLEEKRFKNIIVMPNCKDIIPLSEDNLVYSQKEPYKLCTFSRVMKEKGIEDALNAVKRINEGNDRIIYVLDIYGQVDPNQIQWFEELKNNFPEYIKYKGLVDFDKSVDVIKDYFALIFPTKFFTEGIPGTILDAYAAGVPVISSKWESFTDLIDDGKTGIGYEFGNVDELELLLMNFAYHPNEILDLKKNCIEKSKQFSPKEIIKRFDFEEV